MTEKKPDNPPLFSALDSVVWTKIDLRDLFAAFALVAIDINEKRRDGYSGKGVTVELVASHAYALADAMLREREKRHD